jgi:hypothetical protein
VAAPVNLRNSRQSIIVRCPALNKAVLQFLDGQHRHSNTGIGYASRPHTFLPP